MAKLPRTGAAYQYLDERDTTFAKIVSSLGLKPLSEKAEREFRDRLGLALAKWDEPKTALQIKHVVGSLNAHAKRLDEIALLGAVTRMGFAHAKDIETSGRLARCLTSNPAIGSIEAAHAYLEDFCHRAGVIAWGCRATAMRLQSTKGQSGKSRYDWYDEFTAVLMDVCRQNKIKPTVRIDRISGEPDGTLSRIASAFERVLLPKMRSPNPAAMVKRLQRSSATPGAAGSDPLHQSNPTRETSFEADVADRTLFSKGHSLKPVAGKLAAAWGASAAA